MDDTTKQLHDEMNEQTADTSTTDATQGAVESQPAQSDQPADDYKDKYIRLLAEFNNYQRQKDEELRSMAKFGARNLLLKVVDIVDDIEMGLLQENLVADTKNILEILQSKIMHLLSLEGVTEISLQTGDVFDAHTAEVLSTMNDENNKGKVIHLVRKGYMIGDRVLRTAKVVVGK